VEEARAALRNEWENDPTDSDRERILDEAQRLIECQLAMVRARQKTLSQFARELTARLRLVDERRAELGAKSTTS
jgi:hypothetical protein